MEDELTDDALTGSFRVFQRRRGHRYSLDDLTTAYFAAQAMPNAARYLDLGCGIGSVLLMVAHKLPPSTELVGVEAQAQSAALARKNVERNQLGLRTTIHETDLREVELEGRFDLITGTPPYQRPGTASPSTDAQRTYARIEMRGGIEAYLLAAARFLAPSGRFIACADARTPARAIEGAAAAGLEVHARRDVIGRAVKKRPLFSVWTFGFDALGEIRAEEPFVARDEHGARTESAHALRRFFDLPVNEGEPASP